jgi:copper/silver efflux system protein
VDVEGRDIGGYVSDAQRLLRERLTLPTGYTLEWSGQFEAMERVREKMQLVLPITLGLIFLLLFLHFRNVTQTIMVMGTLPFALVGGIWLLWLLDYNTSVAVWVGLIALAGVASETAVVMLVYLDGAFHQRSIERGPDLDGADIHAAVMEGAVERLRPKMMTVLSTIGGLLPLMWATGAGAATMQRIAAPMVGGLVTSTLLTLIVIPVVYTGWREWQIRRGVFSAVVQEEVAGIATVPAPH